MLCCVFPFLSPFEKLSRIRGGTVEISLPLQPGVISPTMRTSQARSSLHVLRHCAACVLLNSSELTRKGAWAMRTSAAPCARAAGTLQDVLLRSPML